MNTWKRPNENHFCQTIYFSLTSHDNKKQEKYLVLQHLKNSHHQHLIYHLQKFKRSKRSQQQKVVLEFLENHSQFIMNKTYILIVFS
jgi:hypothetical protein